MIKYRPNLSLPPAWIVDIDGTVALGHFGEPGRRGPFDWDRVGEDDPNIPVIRVVNAVAEHDAIVFLSGRSEVCRDQTAAWLRGNGVATGMLYMRPADDYVPDAALKRELLWNRIAPQWNVLGVIDDRDQTVAMWRQVGLTCLQVAPGDF